MSGRIVAPNGADVRRYIHQKTVAFPFRQVESRRAAGQRNFSMKRSIQDQLRFGRRERGRARAGARRALFRLRRLLLRMRGRVTRKAALVRARAADRHHLRLLREAAGRRELRERRERHRRRELLSRRMAAQKRALDRYRRLQDRARRRRR